MTHPTDDELEAMAVRFDKWHYYGYKMPSHIQADGDDAAAMLRACKGVIEALEAERDAMCAALHAMSDHGGEDADTHELRHRND